MFCVFLLNSPEVYLPQGRKSFYYEQYRFERSEQNLPYASLMQFRTCWRIEVPWLVICHSLSSFTRCGLCEYLKMQVDLCPRANSTLLATYQRRLGRHWQFQSSQRVRIDRVAEICRQSEGARWLLITDKMDQVKTIIPMEWSQASTPLFKLGDRLVSGIIGCSCSGCTKTDLILRTVFEDCKHGSNMAASALLQNIVTIATREGRLCEELAVNADNTVRHNSRYSDLNKIIFVPRQELIGDNRENDFVSCLKGELVIRQEILLIALQMFYFPDRLYTGPSIRKSYRYSYIRIFIRIFSNLN